MARVTAILTASLVATAAPAAAPNTSVYSPLDMERCTLLEEVEEGAGALWRCPGHGALALFVATGDGRFDVDAGIDNGQWESLGPFNRPGPRIEWRLRGGRPFAIIYRLVWEDGVGGRGSTLIVESIGRSGQPGCQIDSIDGALPYANELARRRADRIGAGFLCPPPSN